METFGVLGETRLHPDREELTSGNFCHSLIDYQKLRASNRHAKFLGKLLVTSALDNMLLVFRDASADVYAVCRDSILPDLGFGKKVREGMPYLVVWVDGVVPHSKAFIDTTTVHLGSRTSRYLSLLTAFSLLLLNLSLTPKH